MTLPGGRGGVMMAVLAVWTALAVVVVVGTAYSQIDDTIAYNQRVSQYPGGIGEMVMLETFGQSNPQLLVGTVFLLTGCMWLPVAVALLIASIALWSRRT